MNTTTTTNSNNGSLVASNGAFFPKRPRYNVLAHFDQQQQQQHRGSSSSNNNNNNDDKNGSNQNQKQRESEYATTTASTSMPSMKGIDEGIQNHNASYLSAMEAMPYSYPEVAHENYGAQMQDMSPTWFEHTSSNPADGATPSSGATSSMLTSSGMTTATTAVSSLAGSNASDPTATTGRSLGMTSPSQNLFNMEPMMTEYDSNFYSLWNGTNGNNVMGFESESGERPPPSNMAAVAGPTTPMYLPDDEIKMDYAQLAEFNNGDLDYFYNPMEPGATALPPCSDRERLLGTTGGREPHAERLLSASDFGKRDRLMSEDAATKAVTAAGVGGTKSTALGPLRSSYTTVMENTGYRFPMRTSLMDRAGLSALSSASSASASSAQLGSMPETFGSALVPLNTDVPSPTSSGSLPSPNFETGTPGSELFGHAKRPRSRECDHPGCTNRARSHQKCKKHGGAHQCVYEGCLKNSQSRGLCIAHGGGSRYKVEGCIRASQSKGLCKSHGGGEFCAVDGCKKKAHLKHLCRTHGGGVRCKNPKCAKWAQRKGWCMAHAKEYLGT